MIIQIIRKYNQLASEGKVKKLLCENDPEHGQLYPNVDDDDKYFLYCLACEHKRYLGMFSIQYMFLQIIENSDLDNTLT